MYVHRRCLILYLSLCYCSRSSCKSVVFFFFKQKTAYEIEYGLVGSEMCIRDSPRTTATERRWHRCVGGGAHRCRGRRARDHGRWRTCLLYTSDAADERSSVDLGGRRIIKTKNKEEKVIWFEEYTNRNNIV